jgi:hypothetical protein
MKEKLEKDLLIFTLLVTQSELYGYSLKGNVNAQFSHKLKKYLESADGLIKFINKYIDSDVLEDESEQISRYLEDVVITREVANEIHSVL